MLKSFNVVAVRKFCREIFTWGKREQNKVGGGNKNSFASTLNSDK